MRSCTVWNWKDTSVRIAAHEASASQRCRTEDNYTSSYNAQYRHQCFLKLLLIVKFLAGQALLLRGAGDELDSNYIQLLKLHGEDDPRVFDWIKRKTDKHMSADMQNEMIKIMAFQILHNLVASLHTTPFYIIMADKTTDMPNYEQVVVGFRWVSDTFEVHEESIDANTLVSVIKDVL